MFYHPRMRWAEPDVAHASEQMRWVYDNRVTAKRLAEEAVASLEQRYSLESVGAAARVRLMELLERTDRRRYGEVRKRDHARISAPTAPIPAGWFDADYFETGLKNNWERGYHWPHFEGLFRRTAAFLTSAFVDARSFLDAGCAKGFLVRALRERGREAWGCDISEWAIAKADPYAKPYLFRASVDKLELERDYDVLVAFHLLSQLTEDQVHAFLTRVRPRIRIAICAVIPLYETPEHKTAPGGDLGHITRESRRWWDERFLRAGWRQDALHKNLETALQRQDLPQTMLWQIFLYSSAAER
jgi:2-polyprenyl-3-methyl-5-hydroxy-6-metoxy-1,4-benzoquinol methylase